MKKKLLFSAYPGFIILLLMIITQVFSGCQQKANNVSNITIVAASKSNAYGKCSITVDTVSIQTDSIGLKFYPVYSVSRENDSLLFYGYNKKAHSVDLYSLTGSRFLKRMSLERAGPNGTRSIEAIYVCHRDSIFVFDGVNILMFNSKCNIIKRWAVNPKNVRLQSFFSQYSIFTGAQPSCFFYNRKSNSVLVRCISTANSLYGKHPKKYFEMPFVANYDLTNNQMTLLPVAFPEEYVEKFYGFLEHPYISYNFRSDTAAPEVVVTYPALPNIYLYDLTQNSEKIIKVSSDYSKSEGKSLSWSDVKNEDKKMKYMYETAQYLGTVSDSSSRYKFRLHFNEMTLTNKSDFKENMENRAKILTVFDSDFNIVHEELLTLKEGIPQFSFCRDNELYLSYYNKTTENSLNFYRIAVNKK